MLFVIGRCELGIHVNCASIRQDWKNTLRLIIWFVLLHQNNSRKAQNDVPYQQDNLNSVRDK